MFKNLIKYAFGILALLLISCNAKNKQIKHTDLLDNPIVIEQNGNEIFQYWELSNEASLWKEIEEIPDAIQEYRDSLKIILGDKYDAAVKEKQEQRFDTTMLAGIEDGDFMNLRLVLNGGKGVVRKINNLEAQLLNYQLNRYPLLGHPTEFQAYIAFNENSDLARVYFAASDQPWPPKATIINKKLEEDLEKGWRLEYHLHNHYCDEDRDYVGILAPSLADAQAFKMIAESYQLKKALITNGYSTVEIDNSYLEDFESH